MVEGTCQIPSQMDNVSEVHHPHSLRSFHVHDSELESPTSAKSVTVTEKFMDSADGGGQASFTFNTQQRSTNQAKVERRHISFTAESLELAQDDRRSLSRVDVSSSGAVAWKRRVGGGSSSPDLSSPSSPSEDITSGSEQGEQRPTPRLARALPQGNCAVEAEEEGDKVGLTAERRAEDPPGDSEDDDLIGGRDDRGQPADPDTYADPNKRRRFVRDASLGATSSLRGKGPSAPFLPSRDAAVESMGESSEGREGKEVLPRPAEDRKGGEGGEGGEGGKGGGVPLLTATKTFGRNELLRSLRQPASPDREQRLKAPSSFEWDGGAEGGSGCTGPRGETGDSRGGISGVTVQETPRESPEPGEPLHRHSRRVSTASSSDNGSTSRSCASISSYYSHTNAPVNHTAANYYREAAGAPPNSSDWGSFWPGGGSHPPPNPGFWHTSLGGEAQPGRSESPGLNHMHPPHPTYGGAHYPPPKPLYAYGSHLGGGLYPSPYPVGYMQPVGPYGPYPSPYGGYGWPAPGPPFGHQWAGGGYPLGYPGRPDTAGNSDRGDGFSGGSCRRADGGLCDVLQQSEDEDCCIREQLESKRSSIQGWTARDAFLFGMPSAASQGASPSVSSYAPADHSTGAAAQAPSASSLAAAALTLPKPRRDDSDVNQDAIAEITAAAPEIAAALLLPSNRPSLPPSTIPSPTTDPPLASLFHPDDLPGSCPTFEPEHTPMLKPPPQPPQASPAPPLPPREYYDHPPPPSLWPYPHPPSHYPAYMRLPPPPYHPSFDPPGLVADPTSTLPTVHPHYPPHPIAYQSHPRFFYPHDGARYGALSSVASGYPPVVVGPPAARGETGPAPEARHRATRPAGNAGDPRDELRGSADVLRMFDRHGLLSQQAPGKTRPAGAGGSNGIRPPQLLEDLGSSFDDFWQRLRTLVRPPADSQPPQADASAASPSQPSSGRPQALADGTPAVGRSRPSFPGPQAKAALAPARGSVQLEGSRNEQASVVASLSASPRERAAPGEDTTGAVRASTSGRPLVTDRMRVADRRVAGSKEPGVGGGGMFGSANSVADLLKSLESLSMEDGELREIFGRSWGKRGDEVRDRGRRGQSGVRQEEIEEYRRAAVQASQRIKVAAEARRSQEIQDLREQAATKRLMAIRRQGAAICIQRVWREYLERNHARLRALAATRRRHLARQRHLSMLRRWRDRARFLHLRRATVFLQALRRRTVAHRWFRRVVKAVLLIQRRWRAARQVALPVVGDAGSLYRLKILYGRILDRHTRSSLLPPSFGEFARLVARVQAWTEGARLRRRLRSRRLQAIVMEIQDIRALLLELAKEKSSDVSLQTRLQVQLQQKLSQLQVVITHPVTDATRLLKRGPASAILLRPSTAGSSAAISRTANSASSLSSARSNLLRTSAGPGPAQPRRPGGTPAVPSGASTSSDREGPRLAWGPTAPLTSSVSVRQLSSARGREGASVTSPRRDLKSRSSSPFVVRTAGDWISTADVADGREDFNSRFDREDAVAGRWGSLEDLAGHCGEESVSPSWKEGVKRPFLRRKRSVALSIAVGDASLAGDEARAGRHLSPEPDLLSAPAVLGRKNAWADSDRLDEAGRRDESFRTRSPSRTRRSRKDPTSPLGERSGASPSHSGAMERAWEAREKKPFLRRKSRIPSPIKLDWSKVKPQVVTRLDAKMVSSKEPRSEHTAKVQSTKKKVDYSKVKSRLFSYEKRTSGGEDSQPGSARSALGGSGSHHLQSLQRKTWHAEPRSPPKHVKQPNRTRGTTASEVARAGEPRASTHNEPHWTSRERSHPLETASSTGYGELYGNLMDSADDNESAYYDGEDEAGMNASFGWRSNSTGMVEVREMVLHSWDGVGMGQEGAEDGEFGEVGGRENTPPDYHLDTWRRPSGVGTSIEAENSERGDRGVFKDDQGAQQGAGRAFTTTQSGFYRQNESNRRGKQQQREGP